MFSACFGRPAPCFSDSSAFLGACLFAEFSVACPPLQLELELLDIIPASALFLAPRSSSFTVADRAAWRHCFFFPGRESAIATVLAFPANSREPPAQTV